MLPMLPMLPGRTHAPASFIPGAQLMMREEEDEAEQLFHIMFLHVTFIKINIKINYSVPLLVVVILQYFLKIFDEIKIIFAFAERAQV